MGVEEAATRVLERVKIMRVFDVLGVVEAVEEIRDGLQNREEGGGEDVKGKKEEDGGVGEEEMGNGSERRGGRRVVADSEDEDEDGEEMLFDGPEAPTESSQPRQKDDVEIGTAQQLEAEREASEQTDTDTTATRPRPTTSSKTTPSEEKVSFILIDNLAHVVSPLLQKDQDQGMLSLSFSLFPLDPFRPVPPSPNSPNAPPPRIPHMIITCHDEPSIESEVAKC
jgi:hypothetical protein